MNNEEAIYKLKVNLTDTCIADCRCKEGEYSACDFCDDREAVKIAIKALEKKIPKKPIRTKYGFECQKCREYLCDYNIGQNKKEYLKLGIRDNEFNFCDKCGQAQDWSDDE